MLIIICFLQSKRRPKLFWISAAAPLTSVVLGSVLVYLTHAENHGIEVVREHSWALLVNSACLMQMQYNYTGITPLSTKKK
jgi:hypothetical protein